MARRMAFDACDWSRAVENGWLLLHGVVVEISDGGAAFLVIDFDGAAKGMTEKLPRPEYGSIV